MRPRDDAGVTLVEVLVATLIAALISAVIAGAFTVGVRTTDESNKRLAGSHGAQITTAFFPKDVQSSLTITAGTTLCSSATSAVPVTIVTLNWSDSPAAGAAVPKQAKYTCAMSGTQRQLVRKYSENGVLVSTLVLVYDVTAASIACAPNCTTPVSATLTATEAGGFAFSVSGSRRSV